jgi:hypothetical protein
MRSLGIAAAVALGVFAASLPAAGQSGCPATPSWAVGRTASCQLRVDTRTSLGVVTFGSEKSYGKGVTGGLYDCGSDSARCNHAFFEFDLDGYNGTPVTGNSCIGPNKCGQGAKGNSSDLARVWDQVRAETVLYKSLIFQNGWKACGDCTSSAQQPHVDNLQVWGNNNQIVRNMIMQDMIFRNSDDQLLHMTQTGYGIRVLVFQNVLIEQQNLFIQECQKRVSGAGGLLDNICAGGPNTIPSNANDHSKNWDTWLIGVEARQVQLRIATAGYTATTKIILVDTPASVIDLRYHTGTLKQYPSIEAALAAGETKPPFVELSCAGWATKPAGCVSKRGPASDTSGPTNPPPPPPPTALPAPVQLN